MRLSPLIALTLGLALNAPAPTSSVLIIPTESQLEWTVSHLANNLTTLLPIETIKSAAQNETDLVLELVMAIKGEIFGILQKFPMSLSPSQSMLPVREECFDGEIYRTLAMGMGKDKDRKKDQADDGEGIANNPPAGYHNGKHPQDSSPEDSDEDTNWRYREQHRPQSRRERTITSRNTSSPSRKKKRSGGPYEPIICAVCNITRTAGSAEDPCFFEEIPPIIDKSNAINGDTELGSGDGDLLPFPEMPGLPRPRPGALTPQMQMERDLVMAERGTADDAGRMVDDDDGIRTKHVIVPLQVYASQGTDLSYFGKVKMGSHRQEVEVVFDTGSTDLWITTKPQKNSKRQHYQYERSEEYSDSRRDWREKFIFSTASGTQVTDTVNVGPFIIYSQFLGAATSLSEDLQRQPFDGIMGLSYSTSSMFGPGNGFFDRITRKGEVNQIFGFYITRYQRPGSEICIGCYDTRRIQGSITAYKVRSSPYYTLRSTSLRAGDVELLTRSLDTVIDSGTVMIYLPDYVAKAYYAEIPGSSQFADGMWSIPCSTKVVPDFSFGSKSVRHPLDPRDLIVRRLGNNMCVSSIISIATNPNQIPFAILGTQFFKSYYTIFDTTEKGSPRVGFAQVKPT